MNMSKTLACPRPTPYHPDGTPCGYEWTPRVANPKCCPQCRYRPTGSRNGLPWRIVADA